LRVYNKIPHIGLAQGQTRSNRVIR